MSGSVDGVPAVSLKTRVGWIGTGVMGLSMCGHIMERGYSTIVFNRTKEKALLLIEKGAAWVDSPRKVAEQSDVVFTMVGFPDDVREVYFGKGGILEEVPQGVIVVDMTTTEPALAEEIYEAAKLRGVFAVDAPVSGGDVGARNAALSIMTGGGYPAAHPGSDGKEHRLPGTGRFGPAYQNVQPDRDRRNHDRCVRKPDIWFQGRP